ncbi:hypothetical protein ABIE67_000193 [Streptomyces sp. V4I8]
MQPTTRPADQYRPLDQFFRGAHTARRDSGQTKTGAVQDETSSH